MKMSGARNFSFQLRERKGGEDYLISGGRFIFLCFALEKKQEKKKKCQPSITVQASAQLGSLSRRSISSKYSPKQGSTCSSLAFIHTPGWSVQVICHRVTFVKFWWNMGGANPPGNLEDAGNRMRKLQGRSGGGRPPSRLWHCWQKMDLGTSASALSAPWAGGRWWSTWRNGRAATCPGWLLISLHLFFLCWPTLNSMDSKASVSTSRKQGNCHVIAVQRQQGGFGVYACVCLTILHCRQAYWCCKPALQSKTFPLALPVNGSRS